MVPCGMGDLTPESVVFFARQRPFQAAPVNRNSEPVLDGFDTRDRR